MTTARNPHLADRLSHAASGGRRRMPRRRPRAHRLHAAPRPRPTPSVDWELTAQTAAPSGDIDSFTWVSYAEPYSLDYAYAFDYADNQVLANVCESLLRLNPDYTLTPGLAESFEHPTPTTWVYTIRDGVTFHDGTPLTAADVVASMSRHLDPAVGSSWYSVYQNVTSIEQTGDREVTVTDGDPRLAVQPRDGRLGRRHRVGRHARRGGRRLRQLHRRRELHRPVQPDRVEVGRVASRSTRYDDYWDESLQRQVGRGRVPLHERRQRPGQRARSPARSTAAG